MVFSEQQWPLRRDTEGRNYGNVSNRLSIQPARGKEKQVHIVVPTEFFQLAERMFSEEERAATPALYFYLDQVADSWVLGVALFSGIANVDLWAYPTLPTWIEMAMNQR